MKRIIGTGALLLALILGPGAEAAGDPQVGQALASQWCTGCHAGDKAANVSDAAPSLQHIARIRAGETDWLNTWLTSPHPPMPNFNLSRTEIDDIIAYLDTLAKTPQ